MSKGFVYLAVIMDGYSRKILSWRLSISMGSSFCVDALEQALYRYGKPDIFNTDQGFAIHQLGLYRRTEGQWHSYQ